MVAGQDENEVARAGLALKKAEVRAYRKEVVRWKPIIKELKQQIKEKATVKKLQKKLCGIVYKEMVSCNSNTM